MILSYSWLQEKHEHFLESLSELTVMYFHIKSHYNVSGIVIVSTYCHWSANARCESYSGTQCIVPQANPYLLIQLFLVLGQMHR